MLITYFPESTMEYIEAHNSYTFQGTSVFEAIEIDSSFIENKYIDGCVENYTCSWGGTDHPAGGNCTAAYITVDWTCANSGGGGSGSSSSGSGNSPSNNPDPILTAPTYNFPFEQNLIDCLETDNLAILEWINNSANFFQMRDASKLCNADNHDFIIEAIEALLEDGELEFNDTIYVLENEQDYRNKMSDDELALFDTLSTIQQIKYLVSAKEAYDKTEELFETDCEKHNGKGDAFRHALWNALSSSRIGVGLTNLLTTRHENNPPLYPYNNKENQMDLFNNQVGRDIFANGSTNILQDIQEAFNNGELRYLSNQATNCWATFSSQLTPTNL
ncbi:hypothetical protein DI383_08975 [Flavobacteriaceae bacterium LYZ1037]|nr:hypothetical protein DI383_08975 [Flavobacteriaceae bacterium LYZ1037]